MSKRTYDETFPNGPEPIATFEATPEGMKAAANSIGADAIRKAFSEGGGGVKEIEQNIRRNSRVMFNREEFLDALTTLSRVVGKRSTVPILSNVLITARGKWLTLCGTDYDIDCAIKIPATVTGGMRFLASCHNLLAMTRKAMSAMVGLTSEDDKIVLNFGSLRIAIQTLDPDDYPALELPDESFTFNMPVADLLTGFSRCFSSVSTEETRYYLNGVYVIPQKRSLSMVATDGHRLARQEITLPDGAAKMPGMIVPRKTVDVLMKSLAKPAAKMVNVTIYGSKDKTTHLRFDIGNVCFKSKMIDGTFPDYGRVIPTGNTKSLILDREAAIDTIKAVTSITSVKGRPVKLAMNGKTTFSVRDPDVGTASQTIDGALLDDGKPTAMEIGFNSQYLLAILDEMVSEEVELKMADPGSPTLFTGRDDKLALHVLMPMRT